MLDHARSFFHRWGLRLALGLGAAGLLALAFQPWRLAHDTIQQIATQHLGERWQLAITAGSGRFALLPLPRVILHDVKVSTRDGAVEARMARLRADVDLWAALQARMSFDHVILFAPALEVRLASAPLDALAFLTNPVPETAPATPRLSIRENGSLLLRQGENGLSAASHVNVDIAAREPGAAVKIEGDLIWRGEPVAFAFASDARVRETLPMLRVRSDLASLDFQARRGLGATAPLEGTFQLSARSTARLAAWLSTGSPVLLPLGATALQGQAIVTPEGLQLRSATLALGNDALEGALDLRRRDARWLLTGTLAGRSLDIGRPQAGVETGWLPLPDPSSTTPFDLADIFAHDIDLRLSLQRVRAGNATLTDVAAQIMANEQRFDLALTNAQFYRGVARGRAQIMRNGGLPEVRLQASLDRVDVGALSQDLFEARRLAGQGQLTHQLEMRGASPAEMLGNAQGRFALTLRNGDVMGANLSETMRRLERQPLSVARDWRGGRTSFEALIAQGAIINGVMALTEARMSGPGYALTVDGQMSLSERTLRLSGQVASGGSPSVLPFDVAGPLGEPVVNINPSAFLERSGAAAPFFAR